MWNLLLGIVLIVLLAKNLNKNKSSLGLVQPYQLECSSDEAKSRSITEDPSLVRLTSKGPFADTGCIHVENPGTLVNRCMRVGFQPVFKTSSQWYLTRPEKTTVILDPTGWTEDLANPTLWWYSYPINYEDYTNRLNNSALAHVDLECSRINKEPF